ncbi:MAG: tRNA (adenosine(37)-N6)-threonylcarbamoyltransferase complex transferase subunit TsaD [Nitrospirota bacterium]|nr:tRNA (adenosine(37)-N6)-threonylcarbamoyltransferase complex transferase subunit TsaD [Nitrospirota bacterium]
MFILGIETSCDETAASVLSDRTVLSSIVSSQVALHERYGGVVPELASREHLRNIIPVVREALDAAKVRQQDLGLIAVTHAPGLIGALLVGVSTAKAMAYALHIPFIGVHHGEGHIVAAHLEYPKLEYPYVALLVSGGHTALYHIRNFGSYELIGQTRDDAAGEAFDKVAKLLDLPYPGGPVIDRLSREGDPKAIPFPRGVREGSDFSFSGLKTAVRNHVALFRSKDRGLDPGLKVADVAASFQQAVVDTLVEKTVQAAASRGLRSVVMAGGVAANSGLRSSMEKGCQSAGIRLFIPGMGLCVDNAAMIALAGYLRFSRGERSALDLNPRASMGL